MAKDQLRMSQVVTTFGPGAVIDLPDNSVIVAGLDSWQYDHADSRLLHEPRLVQKVRDLLENPAIYLRTPPPSRDEDHGFKPKIKVFQFPEWFIVQQSVLNAHGFRQRQLVHISSLDKGKFRDTTGKRVPVVPIRFVRACKKAHIDDIDWRDFAHGGRTDCTRELWFEERGTSGSLEEVVIRCECEKERPMSYAARGEGLGSCSGRRPWLGPYTREKCDQHSRLLIRTASNAYFPQLLSVISIPETQTEVDRAVAELWDDFLSDVEDHADLEKLRRKPTVAAKLTGFENLDVLHAITRRNAGTTQAGSVKDIEFEALSNATGELASDTPDGDFYARFMPAQLWEGGSMQAVDKVVLVHRLREVVAQVGFTRFEAAGPNTEGELDIEVERAPLALDATWVPAIENRGEGVFLRFNADRIGDWAGRVQTENRSETLQDGFDIWLASRPASKRTFPGLPYVMLHSLSHLLMTEISLECGYPASSLRERIYARPGNYGILIYTAAADSEGTLGGLVEAGRNIRRLMAHALDRGTLCSNDPVCAFHKPAANDPELLMGSSCHGCLLVPETSCEQHNDFLDRALVVRTLEDLGAEFFDGIS